LAVCAATEWGGNEKWFLRTCEGLARRGDEIDLVVRISESYRAHMRAPEAHLRLHELPLRGDGDLYSLARLIGYARKADLILASKERGFLLGGLAGKIAGVPVVLRHGVVRELRDKLSDRLRYGILPSGFIVNAAEIRDVWQRRPWMRDKTIHVMYNGVDAPGPLESETRKRLRWELGVGPDTLLLMGVGRLAADKRWNWFIDATADLSDRGHDVTSVVFGKGKMQETFEARIAERGVEDRFRLLGFRPDVEDWVGAADILVHPSELEGLPNVVLEAMGRAVPAVSTRAGGISEIITSGDQALLCDVDDYDGFVDGIERLVRDPSLRERLGASGLSYVREHHGWEPMVDLVEPILTDLLADKDGTDG
jgi:glycosyltransferase involved in cell wall biosynthesis